MKYTSFFMSSSQTIVTFQRLYNRVTQVYTVLLFISIRQFEGLLILHSNNA